MFFVSSIKIHVFCIGQRIARNGKVFKIYLFDQAEVAKGI